jgi:hypothetical protein
MRAVFAKSSNHLMSIVALFWTGCIDQFWTSKLVYPDAPSSNFMYENAHSGQVSVLLVLVIVTLPEN